MGTADGSIGVLPAAVRKRWWDEAGHSPASGRTAAPESLTGDDRIAMFACFQHATITDRMAKNIQLRNVPDDLHRTLKARAALAGLSLSDFLLDHARRLAERPTLEEMRERLARREPVHVSESAAEVLRRERDDPRDPT